MFCIFATKDAAFIRNLKNAILFHYETLESYDIRECDLVIKPGAKIGVTSLSLVPEKYEYLKQLRMFADGYSAGYKIGKE